MNSIPISALFAKELSLIGPSTNRWVPEIIDANNPEDTSYYPFMNGQLVFKNAVVRFSEVILEGLYHNGLDPKDIDLLINTSSCGMKTTDKLPIKLDHLPPKSLVYDIIYNPRETILMKEAKLYGLKNYNGLFMLIRQAAESFHKWFNIDLTNEDILNAINLLKNHD